MTTSVQRPLVLLNPGSGSVRDIDEVKTLITERLPGAKIFVSQKQGDIENAAAEALAQGHDAVIAAGGDGTLNEALNGCMKSDAPILGLIPLGTGNDFARSIGLPAGVNEAVEVVRSSTVKRIDVIRVTRSGSQPHFMINVAAGGFAGLVSENLTPEIKASWGPLSYLKGMFDALGEMQIYQSRFRVDDEEPRTLSMLNIVIANGSHVARGIPIAPKADPVDGLMDVVAIREVSLPALALLAPEILAATHLNNREILHFRARRFSIESTPPMIFNADGEVLGEVPIEFEVLPGAISFLVPAQKEL